MSLIVIFSNFKRIFDMNSTGYMDNEGRIKILYIKLK